MKGEERTCSTCRYAVAPLAENVIECRRSNPTLVDAAQSFRRVWPRVDPRDWCAVYARDARREPAVATTPADVAAKAMSTPPLPLPISFHESVDVGDHLHVLLHGFQHYYVEVKDVVPSQTATGGEYYEGHDPHEGMTLRFHRHHIVERWEP